jgi:hypothetical protein
MPSTKSTPDQPTVEIVEVSPELAESWLSKNPNNRNLRRSVVDGYARDMSAERWALNGETVKFAADGHLFDGQHRLNAIIVSGATVPMVVVRGLSPTSCQPSMRAPNGPTPTRSSFKEKTTPAPWRRSPVVP